MVVLAGLESGPLHGYAIIEELRRRSGGRFDLPEGTVYPLLHRMERAGLLKSAWATVQGRRRRLYRLSRSGTAALAAERAEWREFSAAVGGFLGAPA